MNRLPAGFCGEEIELQPDVELVGEAPTGREALAMIISDQLDVVLLAARG